MMSTSGQEPGRQIQIESEDGALGGYVAVPATGQGPGVLVLQEWWGLVPQIRSVCDRLARAGFVALAPDLYRGESTADPDAAGRLMMELEIERAGRDLGAAVEALRRQPETDGATIGCIGFCMGGQLALYGACQRPEIGAVVDCYGVHPKVTLDLEHCRARILGIFAGHDEFIPASAVAELESALDRAGLSHTLLTYEGVQHAFLNDARPDVFDADAAARAWRDIESFLKAELR
jgi:carboxymethylenebutenolidase